MTASKPLLVAPSGRTRSLLSALALTVALASSLSADQIYLVSGDPIEDCTIVAETMSEVTYKDSKRKEQSVPAADVLSIDYSKVPNLVQRADTAVKEDDLSLAYELFSEYLTGHLEDRPEKRQLWAPAYAANQIIDLNEITGDPKGTVKAAKVLIDKFPDSRYVPGAYMTMATAMAEMQDEAGAKSTLDKLENLIVSKDLSKRWSLECRLFKILVDSALRGEPRRTALSAIETDAGGEYPTVRNRATVALGESHLVDAGPTGKGGEAALAKARGLFEDVIADPSADEETLAGAYTGLGDCQFQVAAASREAEDINESLMTFLRVVVLYRDEVRYAPKAMFYAGRCFNLLGSDDDNDRANKLYSRVIRNHETSTWADQARDFRKK